MKKLIITLIIFVILAGAAFIWSLMRDTSIPIEVEPGNTSTFSPFNRSGTTPSNETDTEVTPSSSSITSEPLTIEGAALPRLRHLSITPIGGYMASTTGSGSVVRYVDRGVGHVYEALSTTSIIEKISNTTIPRVYESYWNKNLNAAVLRYVKDEAGTIINFYAEIKKVPVNASSTNQIPYEIKGKFLSADIKEVAVSPKADRIFTLNVGGGKGVGYISGFDESKKTKVFDTPLTQVILEWPEENTLTLTTKASGTASGYLYFIDVRKPTFKRILGNIPGLATKASPDLKKVLFSSTNSQGFGTGLYNLADNSTQAVVFKTTTEKCVWSKLHPTELYCAVPTELPTGLYPDDWYKGNISFVDQIWHLDTVTGEVTLIANLLDLSNDLIDVIHPVLDPKENFLYFMNKKDLTLWSLDLNE